MPKIKFVSLLLKIQERDLENRTFPSITHINSASHISYLCTDGSVLLQSISLSKQCFESVNKKKLCDP